MNWERIGKGIVIFFLAGMLASATVSFVVTIVAVSFFGVYGIYLDPVFSLLNMIFSTGVGVFVAWYSTRNKKNTEKF